VPPAPRVALASRTSLQVDVLPGCNPANGPAQFALSLGGGPYTLGTHWVQANGMVGTTATWQTEAAWATTTVTGLTTGTAYTFKAQARFSSLVTQPTGLSAGTTLALQTPAQPKLQMQREGSNLVLAWPDFPGAHLEWTTNLSKPMTWNTVTNQVAIAGGQKTVTISPSGNSGYCRLVLD
jgi:hypothetical protein